MAKSDQGLEMTQTPGLFLTQQQIRFVRMLEMNAPELDEAVERELEENPALDIKDESHEEERDRYPVYRPNYGADEEMPQFSPPDMENSIYDTLYAQLAERRLPPNVELGARFIIASLDSNGYLLRPLSNLVDDMAFGPGIDLTPEEAREALDAVRSLDPPGIGASSLRDCLELQLIAMPDSDTRNIALRIIREAYEPFTLKHKRKIMSQLKISEDAADRALNMILGLNPKPGASLGFSVTDEASVIIPDFIVNVEEGEISVSLNNKIPELRIDMGFEQAMKNMERTAKGRPKKGSEYIVRSYNDARDFIKILSQRQQTMLSVMTAIIKIQKEYFLTEDVYNMKPMGLKDVSAVSGLDMSVISRATNNKFVALPWGIFPMRFFFSDAVGGDTDGTDAATNRQIEAEIRRLVESEDKRHPLSDRKITEEMVARGFDLSRRTVAKYRDRLEIPVARLRKEM